MLLLDMLEVLHMDNKMKMSQIMQMKPTIIVTYKIVSLTYIFFCFTYSSLPLPQLLASSDLFTVSIVLPFPVCHIVRIIQYVAFSSWLLSLRNMCLRSLYVFSMLDITHLLSVLNSTLLSRSLQFIHSMKDILVASKFW